MSGNRRCVVAWLISVFILFVRWPKWRDNRITQPAYDSSRWDGSMSNSGGAVGGD